MKNLSNFLPKTNRNSIFHVGMQFTKKRIKWPNLCLRAVTGNCLGKKLNFADNQIIRLGIMLLQHIYRPVQLPVGDFANESRNIGTLLSDIEVHNL